MLVYDTRRNLAAFAIEKDGKRLRGGYVPTFDANKIVRLAPGDLWFATMQTLAEMPAEAVAGESADNVSGRDSRGNDG